MLAQKIKQDLLISMKAGQTERLEVVRFVLSKIKNAQIEKHGEELTDDEVLGLIKGLIKKANESIEMFEKGGRDDLVAHEKAQLAIMQEYMPAQMSVEEVQKIVADAVSETSATSIKEMGRVMQLVMSKVGVSADGKVVSDLVKQALNS